MLAGKDTVIHATHQVVLDVCIKTVAGRTVIRNISFLVIQEPLLDLLIGVEVLEMLGISPLQILIEKQHEGFLREVDMQLPDSHSSEDDIEDEGNPIDNQVRSVSSSDPITEGMENLVADALKEGLPKELEAELRRVIFSHREVWENEDVSEPTKVHPMILQMKPGAIPVRCAARRYTPEQSLW